MIQNRWSIPRIINKDDNLEINSKDDKLIRLVNDNSKMEIFLDVFGYKTSDLTLVTKNGQIYVRGTKAGINEKFERMFSCPGCPILDRIVSYVYNCIVSICT